MLQDPNIRRVHLIGIAGISMSAIARFLMQKNYIVTGSDRLNGQIVDALKEEGVMIQQGHDPHYIKDADIVIYSSAVNEENKEMVYAKEHNIPALRRSHFMGELTKSFETSIAVTGTHGKTTITSMMAVMLLESKLDSNIFVGANVPELNGNCYFGKDDIILNETCEYQNSHLDFDTNLAIINNIELDHTDFYKDLSSIKESFLTFANHIREGGTLIVNNDDKNIRDILEDIKPNIISYSLEGKGDYQAKNIHLNGDHFPEFDVYKNGEFLTCVSLHLPGRYNIYNAMAAITAIDAIGQLNEKTLAALSAFKGPQRRFEYKGKLGSTLMYDDYAHHPTAIKNLIRAIKELYPNKSLHMAFQPHTYSRTHSLFDSFGEAFYQVDHLYLMDIYAAREQNLSGVSSKSLAKRVNLSSKNAEYVKCDQDLLEIVENLKENDIFITVGAGDIVNIHKELQKHPNYQKSVKSPLSL